MNSRLLPSLSFLSSLALLAPPVSSAPEKPRHLIYLHGAIVQREQSARPRHPEFGAYELERILDALRGRGFAVSGGIRPRAATVEESAARVVAEVRVLLASGVPTERITLVGASMGAGIALLAATRLGEPELRLVTLGACLSENVRRLIDSEGRAPQGHLLAIREQSDETTTPCAPWRDDRRRAPGLESRELVVATGLRHGFLYRPLPEWLDPTVEWATRALPSR